MAQQKGILPITGTIGNITFYKSGEGFMVKQKTSVSAGRIKSDPAYQRTRENGAEFGRAGSAGKTLRTALRGLLLNTADKRAVSRLTAQMIKVIQADTVNTRGMRKVLNGNAALLTGFEFNINGKLAATLFAPFTMAIDRVTGSLTVFIPPFVPANSVIAPEGATHFRIKSAGLEADFDQQQYTVDTDSSADLPWDNTPTADIKLRNTVTANSTQPLFLALGIEFSQLVNGTRYPLKNGAFNALALVQVAGN